MDWSLWLNEYYKDELARTEAACGRGESAYEAFKWIDDPYLWSVLLWKEYDGFDAIKATIPDPPDAGTQKSWSGRSGMELGAAVIETYRLIHDKLRLHLDKPFEECSVLDYGCGWGSVLRYFMKDVPLRNLHGCDPHKGIIQVAQRSNPRADIVVSDSLPKRLPFNQKFDVAYALSIWTHLSAVASDVCLDAVHAALEDRGLFLLTVRPPAYAFYEPISKLPGWDQQKITETVRRDGFYFYPLSYPVDGEMTYGETIITKQYIEEHWTDRFDIVDVGMNGISPYQSIIVLRKKVRPH
ncbi:hypothetical protein CK489_29880 [Bradyrhizobium sp. UFLA03-84]|uniref:class I SAM-dependent methyltransferase n=1 Tax=Bradyrhizobium sp. UFLA03-84 TaxID=418599 RepID=UPI000BADDE5F|nr:class I SAM-dependent methyltransferase [Bradyrhizobium sp. UFLA03-84]PAY04831.1 hypothetical protein CK489_29880 [Bradyrhizobium sp. UFLA03-84]